MPNGGGGYLLANYQYQLIKNGTLVEEGDYAGCIKVGDDHYWLEIEAPNWNLRTDEPDDEVIVYMTAAVWERCRAGGTYDWIIRGEYWDDGGNQYRWGGSPADDVELVEI